MSISAEDWSTAWLARIRAQLDAFDPHESPPSRTAREAALHAATRSIEEMRAQATVPATWLRTRLGLSATEEHVAWVLIAAELSAAVRAQLQASTGSAQPTLSLVQEVVYGAAPSLLAWRELAEGGILRKLDLVLVADNHNESTPNFLQRVRVHPRVCGLALGDESVSAEVRRLSRRSVEALKLRDVVASADVTKRVRDQLTHAEAATLIVGSRGAGKGTLAHAVARDAGAPILDIEVTQLATDISACRQEMRRIAREATLSASVVLVRSVDQLGERTALVDELLTNTSQPVVLTSETRTKGLRLSRPIVQVEMAPVTTQQRATLWKRAVPSASETDLVHLAAVYPLAPALIHHVGRALSSRTREKPTADDVMASIDTVLDDQLGELATRVRVTQGWDDIVLADEQLDSVLELVGRIRDRHRVYEDWGFANKLQKGLGIAALLSGPPGTGKTMIAGLVAREVGLPLYQVDLSRMVSKWIGETEKNLAALFDAAEAGNAILLFDEADSLFAKRTEVASSNDRHANLEVNYLLQRLETFTGICILTTNHERAIDEAFRRRLSFHIRLDIPDAHEREALWRAVFPPKTPLDPELDVARLAQEVELTGGHIRNAALRAAFLASSDDAPISMEHVCRAALAEYEAIGKIAPAPLQSGARRSSLY